MKKLTILTTATAVFFAVTYFAILKEESEPITQQHEQEVIAHYDQSGGDSSYAPYQIMLDDDIIVVVDAMSGKVIHSEKWDSNTPLAKAIIADNK